MTDATEQIQTPAASEFPVQDVPNQPAATVPPEPQTPESEHPAQVEAALTAEIAQLWILHSDYKSSIKDQTQNLHSLRAELGRKLAAMKVLLAKPGCSGKWSSWLKEHKIARSTADRLVAKHECSLNPDLNCSTGSISEPSEAEVQSLLDKLLPKMRKALPTPASVFRFVELVASSFAMERRVTEEGLVVVKPFGNMAVEQSEPQEAQGELVESPAKPLPVVTEVQVESISASMEISAA